MMNVAVQDVLDQLPAQEIETSLHTFLDPLTRPLPDERFRRTVRELLPGIVGSRSPLLTAMAQRRDRGAVWAQAKRGYRLLESRRFTHRTLYQGLYRIARQTVEREAPPRLVIALDPVNFEKPYTQKLEGVSTVHKATPPDRQGKARLTRGYPAITATVVNTKSPVVSYLDWFSYTVGFVSENRQIYRAIRTSRWLFRHRKLRFVADAGLDDRKVFKWMGGAEFVIRAGHLERIVERYDPSAPGWERQPLEAAVGAMALPFPFRVAFRHAGTTRRATVKLGWTALRLPDTGQLLWALVAKEEGETPQDTRTLVLLTNVPLEELKTVKEVYEDWRLRSRIEHLYRFDQEQGVDVERMLVRTLERMRRLFALVLAATLFVFSLSATWPPRAILWLRQLGGKLERSSDRDGPYLLLRGVSAVLQTVATLTFLSRQPFPHDLFHTDTSSYG